MAQQTNFHTLPPEVLMTIFAFTPSIEIPNLSQVCKGWNSVLVEKVWKPIFEDKLPISAQQLKNGAASPELKVIIATFIQENQDDVDFIISQIEDDAELAKCLHGEKAELTTYKRNSPLERSRILWKAMYKDATPVLVKLINVYDFNFTQYTQNSCKDPNYTGPSQSILQKFQNADKTSPIVKALIERHKVPYNKIEFICAIMPSIYVSPIAIPLLFNIVKSHEDLSELNKRTFQEPGPEPTQAPVGKSVCAICLQAQNTPVTQDDLMQCKLIS